MWGSGDLMTQHKIQEFEQNIASQFPEFCDGLSRFGLKQERRKIRLCVSEAKCYVDETTVTLSFFLPAGCFATTVLR